MRKLVLPIASLLAALALLPAAAAPATTVDVELQAEVTDVWNLDGTLCASVRPGDVIEATYRYTLDTRDSNPDKRVGDFWYASPAAASIYVKVPGGWTQSDPADTRMVIEYLDNWPAGGDTFHLRSDHNLPLSCGTPVGEIWWQLDDPTGTALDSAKLQGVPPRLSDWTSVYGLRVDGPDTDLGVRWDIFARVISARLL